MRLGLVEKGNYKTYEYQDLSGYQLQVNGLHYDFTTIIAETRRRISELWNIPCPPDLIEKRLHFGEERFFNQMMKNAQYGVFSRHTGAHICLGLLPQKETCNLVIHEIAHEIHYRMGFYNSADEVVREMLAIMAEFEYGQRDFDFEPHFTSQQMLGLLMEIPSFGNLSFLERWEILAPSNTNLQVSFLINRYFDDQEGGMLRNWLTRRCSSTEHARLILNALAATTEFYALYNRHLVIRRIVDIGGWDALSPAQVTTLCRALQTLKQLDRTNPNETLNNLMYEAFRGI